MPKLRERRAYVRRVQTNTNLPEDIRQLLEDAIDHVTIHSLTDSIIDAVRKREEAKQREQAS